MPETATDTQTEPDVHPDSEQETLVDTSDIDGSKSKENGNDAESWVIEEYDLEERDPDRYPGSCHDAIDPRTGTPIEIKSCVIRYSDSGSRGMWQIWDYAHQQLKEHDGGYIFVVHEPRVEEFTVYLHRPLSARQVDELIPEESWYPINHRLRPDDAARHDLAQSNVFTNIRVERLEPEEITEEESQPDGDSEFDVPVVVEDDPAQEDRVVAMKEIIDSLEAEREEIGAPTQQVIITAGVEYDIHPDLAADTIESLKQKGQIYEPRHDALRTT